MERVILAVSEFLFLLLTSLWFWIAVGLVLLILVLVLQYRKGKLRALERARYERFFSSDGVFTGESFTLTETLHNPSWFPLFFVHVDFFIPAGLTVDGITCAEYTKVTSIFHVPPFSAVKKQHAMRADRRGHYRLQNADIEYRKNEFMFTSPLEIYSYPARFDADAEIPQELYHAGNAISARKYVEDPFFFAGLRPYQTGDSMRTLNFKASARTFSGGVRQLMSNSYDSSRSFDTMIFLDLSVYANAEGSNESVSTDEGLSYACFLFCEAIKHGGKVGFAANCAKGSSHFVHVPCGAGEAHNKLLLETFAEIDDFARRDYSMRSVLERFATTLPKGTDIYLICSFVDDKTAELLRMMERGGFHICVLNPRKKRGSV